jgi:hypothetical protein
VIKKIFGFSVVFLLLCVQPVFADWQFKHARWLNDLHYSLYHESLEGRGGFLLSSTNVESIQLRFILEEKTLRSSGSKVPFIVKGQLYFDDKKFVDLTLKNGLNVFQFPGQEYEFADDMFDADLYEALKHSKTMTFTYRGVNDKNHRLVIPLANYYQEFNRYITYRRKEFIPGFLAPVQKDKYVEIVASCIDTAEAKVDDLIAKNNGQSLADRQQAVLQKVSQRQDARKAESQREQIKQRVAAAYQFYGDTARPEWLLYQLYTECFNQHVGELN